MNRSTLARCSVAVGVAALVLTGGCANGKTGEGSAAGPGAGGPAPVPVRVAQVERKSMPLVVQTIGNVESVNTVAIMPRVAGQIATIEFAEGRDVERDALLFTLDKRPFEVVLAQAEANLAQARARDQRTASDAKRYTRLLNEGVVSQEQFDGAVSAADMAAAAVTAAEAAVQEAWLELEYCGIRAPFSGRTGRLLVHPGATVKANETALVTLKQLEPIGVTFAVPERHLAGIRERMARHELVVRAIPRSGKREAEGRLVFVDNTVNVAAGTIGLKASFDNINRRLWPGEFVDVRLFLSDQPDAVVIPTAAVQAGQRGDVVFVIGTDGTAELRSVVVDRTSGDEAVIGQGLEPGETVVTDGQVRLAPGARVEIRRDSEAS